MGAESLTDLTQLLKLQQGLHGQQSKQVCDVLVRMGNYYRQQSNWDNAEDAYRRALQVAESLSDSTKSAEIKLLLESCAEARNGAQEEEGQSLRVSSARVPVFAPAAEEALSPENKAPVPLDQAIEKAKTDLLRLKQRVGHNNAAVADAFVRLADLFGSKNMLTEMEPLLQEALKIREFIHGEKHLLVSTDLKNLARLYFMMGRYTLAESFLARAREIRESCLDHDHPQVADICELQARLFRRTGRHEEAEALDLLVIESRSRHGNRWEKLKEVGVKAVTAENWREALKLWVAAMEAAKNFSEEDPRLIFTLESLAEVYFNLEKFAEAEPICAQLLKLAETRLGPEHMDVATASGNLAIICERQEKYAEASMLLQQAISIKEKVLGADDPDVIALREMWQETRINAQRLVESKLERMT